MVVVVMVMVKCGCGSIGANRDGGGWLWWCL